MSRRAANTKSVPFYIYNDLELLPFHFWQEECLAKDPEGVPIPPIYTGPDPDMMVSRRTSDADLHPGVKSSFYCQHCVGSLWQSEYFFSAPYRLVQTLARDKVLSPPFFQITDDMPKRIKDFVVFKQRWVETFYAMSKLIRGGVIPYLHWNTVEEILPYTIYGLQEGAPFMTTPTTFYRQDIFRDGLKEIIQALKPKTVYLMAWEDRIPDHLKNLGARFVYYDPVIVRGPTEFPAQVRSDFDVSDWIEIGRRRKQIQRPNPTTLP